MPPSDSIQQIDSCSGVSTEDALFEHLEILSTPNLSHSIRIFPCAPRHEELWDSGGIAPCIPNVGT